MVAGGKERVLIPLDALPAGAQVGALPEDESVVPVAVAVVVDVAVPLAVPLELLAPI